MFYYWLEMCDMNLKQEVIIMFGGKIGENVCLIINGLWSTCCDAIEYFGETHADYGRMAIFAC